MWRNFRMPVLGIFSFFKHMQWREELQWKFQKIKQKASKKSFGKIDHAGIVPNIPLLVILFDLKPWNKHHVDSCWSFLLPTFHVKPHPSLPGLAQMLPQVPNPALWRIQGRETTEFVGKTLVLRNFGEFRGQLSTMSPKKSWNRDDSRWNFTFL